MQLEDKIKYKAIYDMLTEDLPKELSANVQEIGMRAIEDGRHLFTIDGDNGLKVTMEVWF